MDKYQLRKVKEVQVTFLWFWFKFF